MTPEQIAAAIETSSVVTELRQQHAEQARQLAVLQADGPGGAGGTAALPYRSLAEFIKALADRNARPSSFDARGHAELLTRAYSGATTTDAHADGPAWIKRDVRLVAENRNVLELFSKEPLPAEGMAVSYPQFGSKSGEVGEQAAQGDDLPYLELRITDDSAPVRTYGGYSELSRQAIERAGVPYLAKVLRMQAISYAKQTNGVVRTALAAGAAAYNQLTMPAAPTATEAIDAVLDGAQAVHANSLGLEAEVWLMTLAQFKSLAHITDSAGRPIFVLNGDGSNTIGNANITALRGSVAGFPFVVDLGMTGTYSYMVSSEALTVLEQPGAPFNLEDENIVNLTKQFSLYGYLALTKNDPKGVTRVTHAAQANG